MLAALHNHRANAGKFNFLNSEKKNLFLYFKFNLRDNQFNFTNVLCIERENKIGFLWHNIYVCIQSRTEWFVHQPIRMYINFMAKERIEVRHNRSDFTKPFIKTISIISRNAYFNTEKF